MRSFRSEAIFSRWLENPISRFTDFKDRCDAGDVAGLGPEDFRQTVSDTEENDPKDAEGDG